MAVRAGHANYRIGRLATGAYWRKQGTRNQPRFTELN